MKFNKNKYSAEWNKRVYDQRLIRFPNGAMQVMTDHAKEHGESLNGFVVRATRETIARDMKGEFDNE